MTKKKSPAQLQREIDAALAPSLADLQAACDAARALARLEPSPEHRDAAKAAWDALVAASPKIKPRGGFGSRAGQRQAAEREAERKAALARRRR